MKKISFYILFILVFFLGILNTKAVSEKGLASLNIKDMSKNDSLCVYEFNGKDPQDQYGFYINEDVFTYLVFQFKYNSEHNAYQIINLTLDAEGTFSVYEMTMPDDFYNSKNCSDYYISLISNSSSYSPSYNALVEKSPPQNGLYYKYSDSKTKQVLQNVDIGEETDAKYKRCTFRTSNGTELQLSSFLDGSTSELNYFRTTDNGRIACPATYEKNSTSIYYRRISVDPNNFSCDQWQIVDNPSYGRDENIECYYYLAKASEETLTPGSTGTVQGDLVATYADYNNSDLTIRIIKNADGSYKAILSNKNTTITISNIANYNSIFNSGEKKDYPLWINEIIGANGSTYQLSDKRIDGANNRNFIEVSRILEVVGLGNSEVYKTCQQLFTTDFLKFLNNTFFKILYIGIPIILIVLTTFDFAKVVFSDDKEGIQKAGKTFGKRVVMAVLIYLVPTILIFIGNLMGTAEIEDCAKALQRIGEENKTS